MDADKRRFKFCFYPSPSAFIRGSFFICFSRVENGFGVEKRWSPRDCHDFSQYVDFLRENIAIPNLSGAEMSKETSAMAADRKCHRESCSVRPAENTTSMLALLLGRPLPTTLKNRQRTGMRILRWVLLGPAFSADCLYGF